MKNTKRYRIQCLRDIWDNIEPLYLNKKEAEADLECYQQESSLVDYRLLELETSYKILIEG